MSDVLQNLMYILESWWLSFQASLPQLVAGLLVFILSLYFARAVSKLTGRTMKQRKSDPELTVLLTRLVRWSIISLGIVLALQQAGQNVSALLTGLGILGFTLGFALQDVSANFVAGILLLFQQPFNLGDVVKVAGYSGTIKNVDLRATEIRTFDGLVVLIPNADVFSSSITNFTHVSKRRVSLPVGVGYDSDLEHVRKVALETIETFPWVLTDPAPQVAFQNFGDSAINLTLYYWYDTNATGQVKALDAGVVAIKQAFEKEKIDLPYPIQTLYLHK